MWEWLAFEGQVIASSWPCCLLWEQHLQGACSHPLPWCAVSWAWFYHPSPSQVADPAKWRTFLSVAPKQSLRLWIISLVWVTCQWIGNEYILTFWSQWWGPLLKLGIDRVPEEPHNQSLGGMISQIETDVLQLQERWIDSWASKSKQVSTMIREWL